MRKNPNDPNRRNWEFTDPELISLVLKSDCFAAGSYDSSALQERIGVEFTTTNRVITSMPLALNGERHVTLRCAMESEIQKNYKRAISVLEHSLSDNLRKIKSGSGFFDIGERIKESILISIQDIATIKKKIPYDFSDLTLILDEFQSIKRRVDREHRLSLFVDDINERDSIFKASLSLIGVNALVGSVLNSLIYILEKDGLPGLLRHRHFVRSGLVYIERICTNQTDILHYKIRPGDKIKLNLSAMMDVDLDYRLLNLLLFANGDSHACSGMGYSLAAWRCICRILSENFLHLAVRDFTIRDSDHIFRVPETLIVEYYK